MSIQGITLKNAPTSVDVTGGSDVVFKTDGTQVAAGIRVADIGETDLRLKKHLVFKTKPPQKMPDGTFSKTQRYGSLTMPFEKADGSISYQTMKFETSMDSEFQGAAGNTDNFRNFCAQVFVDAETDDYWDHGATD